MAVKIYLRLNVTHSRSQPCSYLLLRSLILDGGVTLKYKDTDGFVLLKAIYNCFCDTEMHYDPMTYCSFIGHMRVRVLLGFQD